MAAAVEKSAVNGGQARYKGISSPGLLEKSSIVSHVLLVVNTVLPLFVTYPPNVNVIVSASICVFCGCWRSVKTEPPSESMSKKDAMKFPLVGSAMLFGLFLAFKFLPKDMVNLVLSLYFILLGTFGIVATVDPFVAPMLPGSFSKSHEICIPKIPVVLKEGLELEFSLVEVMLSIPSAIFCYWYWTTKHWLANNVLGLAFSLQGVEHLSLGAVQNGVILLCGLFLYDIFWVFCTPVMVSVAKSFDAPIKLLFPKALFQPGQTPEFSMLGLGDIVIPGIFVAIILRYDMLHHRHNYPRLFYSAFLGYVLGIGATIAVMNIFHAAQPALLYIVPSVLGCTFLHAWMVGEAKELYHWSEAQEEAKDSESAKGKKEEQTTEEETVRVTRAAAKADKKTN